MSNAAEALQLEPAQPPEIIPAVPLPPPHATTFYKILQLFNAIDNEVIEAKLDEQIDLMQDGKNKVDGLKHFIDRLQKQMEYFKDRKDEFAAQEKVIKNHITRLQQYVIKSLQDNQFTQFAGHEYVVKLQKSTPALVIKAKATIDHKIKYDEFVTTTYDWNTDDIKEALRSGNPAAAEIASMSNGVHIRFYPNKDIA